MDMFGMRINEHYAPTDLADLILHGLHRAGKDAGRLHYDDLGPVDQFHTRGKQGTIELARSAAVSADTEVLDVGGGLGGAARTLAAEFKARVTVLDLTENYCRVGDMLTRLAGLDGRVQFRHGDALALPFPDAHFDLVWMQHCTMNIDDKERLLREANRVLRPRGRLAMHEIVAGPRQPIHFPVPWATEPALSFLRPASALDTLVRASGFHELAWRDGTADAIAWFRSRLAAIADAPPPLGLHLLLGERFRPAFENLLRNLEEERVAVIEAVYCKT